METKEIDTFSVSRILLWDQCPLAFKFYYIDEIPEIPTTELQIGKAVHKAIEIYCKQLINGQPGTIEEIVAEATNTVSNSEILNEVNEMFRKFVLTHEFNGRKILAVEKEIIQNVAGYKFKGILDLIEIDDSVVTITDWKSGRRIFSQSECDNSLQASAYALLIHKEYPNLQNLETFVCKFDFIRYNQIIETKRTLRDLKLIETYIKRKIEKISDAINNDKFTPKPSYYCEWCSYVDRCPIEVNISKPEEIASRVLVLEAALKDSKARLKTLVEKHGPISINDEVFDFYPSESEIYPVDKFIQVLINYEVDNPFRFLKVDTAELKCLDQHILEKILPLAKQKVATRFGHKRRQNES